MDHSAPGLRLESITPLRQEIIRIWRTFRPVDHAFIEGIVRDWVKLVEVPVDWIFLRTAIEFWNPQHAVFNFRGIELNPTVEEYTALIQRPTPTTQGIFIPNPFAVIRSQLSTLLGIPAQEVHHELHQGWDHVAPRLNAPPCTDAFEGEILVEADRLPYRIQWADSASSAPARFVQIQEIHRLRDTSVIQCIDFPEHPTDEERAFSATSVYVAQFYSQNSVSPQRPQTIPIPRAAPAVAPEAESSAQAAMRTELQSIREERDRLRCKLVNTRAEVVDYRELQRELARARSRAADLDREIARLSTTMDRTRAKARKVSSLGLANETRLNASYGDYSLFPGMRLPSKVKVPEFKTYEGTTDPRHHLCHYRGKMLQYWDYKEVVIHSFQDSLTGSALDWFMSLKAEDILTWADLSRKFIDQYQYFFDLIEAEKKFDMGIKLGRIEGPAGKGKREPSRKTIVGASSTGGRKGKETTVNVVNPGHLRTQPFSVNFAPTPPSTPGYVPPRGHYQPPHPAQPIYYSTPPYRPSDLRAPQSTQHVPPPRGQQGGVTQPRQLKQYTPLPVLLSHIYRQLCSGNKIGTVAPGPNFDPIAQDQSKRCEYHQGAPGHTLDNCWRLRKRIQEMIDAKELSFNAVRPPNVQVNPLPNHGPSINMISICALGEDESEQDIPARELYVDSKVPWTYGEDVGSLQHPFSVIGMTSSGWVYEDSEAVSKGKVLVAGVRAMPEVMLIPPKKVTEEEAEAFIKIIKASEYKVLKETAPDTIEETINLIFSKTISFSDDELPSEGWAHSRALHIVYKCNNYVIGRVMIDNGSALKFCPVNTLNVTFQVLDIPNAFSLLLGRPWIHLAGTVPSSLHERLKFIIEEKLITVKGGEDYAIYKETAIPYISIADDENLSFHSFETISIIRDYGKVPSTGLGARGQGISRPIEVEEYKNRRGLGFCPSCQAIIKARRGNHLHHLTAHYGRLNRGIPVPPLSHFFPRPPHVLRNTLDGPSSDSDNTPDTLPIVYAVTEEIPSGLGPIYFEEGLDEDSRVPEIEESLRCLEDRQLTSVEPTEEINVGTKEEPRILKIGTSLYPTQRARMIDFLAGYQEHFLPLDTEKFPPKRQQLRRQRTGLFLRIKEEVVKQINAEFLEVYNYSEWVANIVPVEKKDGRVRVCVDYRDLNKASPKDNFPLPHIDALIDNTARHTQFSFMDGFSRYNQIRMAVCTQISSRHGTQCACLSNAAWECPPSQGHATDAREKESPFTIYDLKVEGR
ncbi:hypothetical protein CRG98_011149 [Punica granatum]|uniref:G-patch domain-containing protein n=1 Tax=Punica granatum TaxID=22663 RepID=A0A2I0KJG2_PUNGR|nr:hypothetical protein CRG98_011149 [Punica granatum]